MLRVSITACLLLLPFIYVQAAADIHPVPGSGAAYLYFPGESAGRVKLQIAKEFSNMLQDRYEVYYIPRRGGREQLICSADEETCEKLLPAGPARLSIRGFYDPSKKLPINSAKFTGSCSNIGERCELNLKDGNTEIVRITTGCNASEYSTIRVGDRDSVLCVGISPDNKSYLLAAHKNIRGGMMARTNNQKAGFTSTTDGKTNTQIMIDKWDSSIFSTRDSAAHYCQQLSVGKGDFSFSGWYVPALQELHSVLAGWYAAQQSFAIPKDDGKGYFSSTERPNDAVNTYRWDNSIRSDWERWNTAASVVCVYRISI